MDKKINDLYSASVKRVDTTNELRKSGCDINEQIKIIEKGYRGELC